MVTHRADDLDVGQRPPCGVVLDGGRHRVGQRAKCLLGIAGWAGICGGLMIAAARHQAPHLPARMRVIDADWGACLWNSSVKLRTVVKGFMSVSRAKEALRGLNESSGGC